MAYCWEPWHGCHKCSDGCVHCYIHKGDARRGVDTNDIQKTDKFYAPVAKKRDGSYRMQAGLVWLCFSSDFLIEEADAWRGACFDMIRERPDLHFLFLTKRIARFMDCVPADWGEGWDNVTVGCTVENQSACDAKLSVFDRLPIRHKNIICQPLLEEVDIESHLRDVELVVVGGESDREARPFHFEWAVSLREQCVRQGVDFDYRQCGSNYFVQGIARRVNPFQLMNVAREAGLSYRAIERP